MRKILSLFALLLLVIACSERVSYRNVELNEKLMELLKEVATQIPNKPDSVLFVLNEIYDKNRNRLNTKTKTEIYILTGRSHFATGELYLANLFFSKALRLIKAEGYIPNKVRIKINLGTIQSNIKKEIDYYRQARLILGNHQYEFAEKDLTTIYANLSSAFSRIGDSESARYYIQLAVDIARQTGHKWSEAIALHSLALILKRYSELSQAEQVFRNALELGKEINNKNFLHIVLSNLAQTLFLMMRFDEGMPYLERSEEIAQTLGMLYFSWGRYNLYRNRMFLYGDNSNYIKALKMNDNMLKIRHRWGDTIDIARTYNSRAWLYDRMGNFDKVLLYATKALERGRKGRLVDLLPYAYETMAYVHAVQGNIEKFSQAMASSRHYRDSIFTQQRFAAIQELQTRFQTEQKQQEIIQQQKEIYAKRTTIFFLIIISTLVITLFIVLYIFQRRKLQQQIQIIQQHEKLSNYVRKGQQQPIEKTNGANGCVLSDQLSKELLVALDQLFESEKIYLDADLNIVDVANKLGSNRTYLSKAINHYHQKSFSDYVNYYRVEEAKEMLKAQNEGKYTNYTNEYIAEKVGFGSPVPFYRAFKQIVGITPSEYRKVVKKMV